MSIPTSETNCRWCKGYVDSAGFHHDLGCPMTLPADTVQLSYSSNANPSIETKLDEILKLLKSIDEELNRISRNLDTIRIRQR